MARRLVMATATQMQELKSFSDPISGSHYLAVGAGYLLVSTDLSSDPRRLEWWTDRGAVCLPDPTYEASTTLAEYVANPARAFKQPHLDALATLGVTGSDTVMTVSAKAVARFPACYARAEF